MLDLVIEQRRRDIGGFEVGRVLPYAGQRMVGPFIFFDHMGPVDFPKAIPRSVDVRPHPHIGLSTITYLFDGEIMHRDSVGSAQPIRPGEVNWMTAGRGITHSERFEEARAHGGTMHGIQAWVALPDHDEETDPGFVHYTADALPSVESAGVWLRLAAGSAFGMTAPVKTHSPLFYAHLVLRPGAKAAVPDDQPERAAYVAVGSIEHEGRSYGAGQMLVFTPGQPATISATTQAVVMMLGGAPLGPRFIEWNFVSSSQARIAQAKADWRAGRMKLPDADDTEFVPLPPDASPAPEPMS